MALFLNKPHEWDAAATSTKFLSTLCLLLIMQWHRQSQISRNMSGLSGWQRMWIALTATAVLVYGIFFPIRHTNENYSHSYAQSEMADYDSGNCRQFIESPLSSLVEPEYSSEGGTCWFIYTSRTTLQINEVPFTKEKAIERRSNTYWKNLAEGILLMTMIVLVSSCLVYGVGLTIAWIRRGFRSSAGKPHRSLKR